jgi:transposase
VTRWLVLDSTSALTEVGYGQSTWRRFAVVCLEAADEGASARQAAARFSIGISSAIRWIARAKIGEQTPRPQGRRRGLSLDGYGDLIVGMIEERKDITFKPHGRAPGYGALYVHRPKRLEPLAWRTRLDFQKKSAHALEQDCSDILKRRRAWSDCKPDLDRAKLVFIDETGLSTKMARLRGRSPCSKRCRARVPHGHCKTTTFTGALRLTGMIAPFVYDGAINGNVFRAYVELVLVPTLAEGDVVIMDNLLAHTAADVRGVIEAVSARYPRLRMAPTLTPSKTHSQSSRH